MIIELIYLFAIVAIAAFILVAKLTGIGGAFWPMLLKFLSVFVLIITIVRILKMFNFVI